MNALAAFSVAALAPVLVLPVSGQVTTLVSPALCGSTADRASYAEAISADGRYVTFLSCATDLVPLRQYLAYFHTYVRDVQLGRTELVDLGLGGAPGHDSCINGGMSEDGRYVVFTSPASNLVLGDTDGMFDVFVRDRVAGVTERVSLAWNGFEANGSSGIYGSAISGDGRFVAFSSAATNLVPGDTNGRDDIFVRDRTSGTLERVSASSSGGQADHNSLAPFLSSDGRFVTFSSWASDLVPGDTNAHLDAFVHDRRTHRTERVSVGSGGTQGSGDGYAGGCSADGRFVVFYGDSTNLVPGDTNGSYDVFVRDRQTDTTERVSVSSNGGQGDGGSYGSWISPDGRWIAFSSYATNLVPGDVNNAFDAFLRDRQAGTTELVSWTTGGVQANDGTAAVAASADARIVLMSSDATNLVQGDANVATDAFVRDREAASFTSLCDPGSAGVVACPCSNPPSGGGRGCDNSSGSGGASLAASGSAYLSLDALVFHSSGEPATAASLVLQGSARIPAGIVYGQGVRCLGGTLERLYTRTASSGAIDAPDLAAGELPVSVRSDQLGDTIAPGETRYYLVYYRDPIVSGGCPPASAFNSTQTGSVLWFL